MHYKNCKPHRTRPPHDRTQEHAQGPTVSCSALLHPRRKLMTNVDAKCPHVPSVRSQHVPSQASECHRLESTGKIRVFGQSVAAAIALARLRPSAPFVADLARNPSSPLSDFSKLLDLKRKRGERGGIGGEGGAGSGMRVGRDVEERWSPSDQSPALLSWVSVVSGCAVANWEEGSGVCRWAVQVRAGWCVGAGRMRVGERGEARRVGV
mmetsp:Transcript_18859/g.46272  ORF Transcript_18859/g.46272 Transcript_18859/m.46272 type:complete len:209 (+) Transcript_18859:502-1128(+)